MHDIIIYGRKKIYPLVDASQVQFRLWVAGAVGAAYNTFQYPFRQPKK